MREVGFRRLAEMINEPADKTSACFSASFGLDFVWKNPVPKRRTPMISYYPTVPKSSNKIQIKLEMVRDAQ